jgi:hypothetical protein
LLPNGKVLVAGGYLNTQGAPLTSAELYDPASGIWTETAVSPTRALHNGDVIARWQGARHGWFEGKRLSRHRGTPTIQRPAFGQPPTA